MTEFLMPRDLPKHEALKAHAARYPDLDPSAMEACLALIRVAGDTISAFKDYFARNGISQGRFVILVLLNRDPEKGMSPSELAEFSNVTRATITGLLDGLESDGMVKRLPLADDRRSYSICLTPKGKKFLDKMLPDHFKRMSGLMAALSESERKLLIELVFKVRAGLGALE